MESGGLKHVTLMSPSRMFFLSAVLCVALFHLISGQNCSEHCKTCGGPEKDQCLQCHTGYILHDNLCVGEWDEQTVRSIHLMVYFTLKFTSTLLRWQISMNVVLIRNGVPTTHTASTPMALMNAKVSVVYPQHMEQQSNTFYNRT